MVHDSVPQQFRLSGTHLGYKLELWGFGGTTRDKVGSHLPAINRDQGRRHKSTVSGILWVLLITWLGVGVLVTQDIYFNCPIHSVFYMPPGPGMWLISIAERGGAGRRSNNSKPKEAVEREVEETKV